MRNNEERFIEFEGQTIGWVGYRKNVEGWKGDAYVASSRHRHNHLQLHHTEYEAEKWVYDQHDFFSGKV